MVMHLEGSWFESDPSHCIETLGKLFALTCSTLKILHFVNDLMCVNNYVIKIITTEGMDYITEANKNKWKILCLELLLGNSLIEFLFCMYSSSREANKNF